MQCRSSEIYLYLFLKVVNPSAIRIKLNEKWQIERRILRFHRGWNYSTWVLSAHSLDETYSCKNETLLVVQKVIAFWTRRMGTNRFIKSLYGICRTLVYTAVRHKYNRLPYISRAQEWKNDPDILLDISSQAKSSMVGLRDRVAIYKYLEVIAKNHDWDYPSDSAFKYTAYLYD